MTFREQITRDLAAFYYSEGIAVGSFSCSKMEICRACAGGRGIQVGTEAHVGTRYGNARRIVVVSLDAGGQEWQPETVEERTKSIENIHSADDANMHMSGTFEFLSSLLNDQIGDASPMPYFALLNSAKCRATDGTMDQFPRSIHWNCLPFAERELEILNPDIVWLQGAIPRDYFWNHIETFQQASDPSKGAAFLESKISSGDEGEDRPDILAKIGILASCSHRPLVIHTVHPSHRSGGWQRFRDRELQISARVLITATQRRK